MTNIIIVLVIISVFIVLGVVGILLHNRQSTEEMIRYRLSNDEDTWS